MLSLDLTRFVKFSWYLKRLKKIAPQEIPYRLNQILRKKIDKYFPPGILFDTHSENISLNLWRNIENQKSHALELKLVSHEINTIIKEVDEITKHTFEIFDLKVNFGKQINFHLDPKTGKSWPDKFWGDIDYRNAEVTGGIKFAWELNRLHHLPKLAIAYSLTDDLKYLEELFNQIEHWMDTNPYPRGTNWISGIEIGIRIVNLFYMLKYLPLDILTRNQNKLLQNFVFVHSQHLYRYPSKYSSCGNHALAEALGLFISGLCCPSMKNAHNWKAFGKNVLEREVTRQIYLDGSSFEHTIPYLQFVADHFLIFYLICKEYDNSITTEIEKRLKAVCNFISYIVDIKGNIPMIGDDDAGYLLKLWFGEHNNFLSLLNTGSVLFDRPDWICPSAQLDSKTLLLLGNSAKLKWEELKKDEAWKSKSCYFDNAGLSIISHSKKGREIKFIGNSGPLGLEPMSGHGHADALSFFLSINGQPVFIDPGTYLYHSGGKWRRYFRSTAAHNTIQVDGKDQAEQLTDFMFGDFYHVNNIHWSEKDDRIDWGAEHNGYQRLKDPVIHRREVSYIKHGYSFKMADTLKCLGKHDVKLFFHLHPNIKVRAEGGNTFHLSMDDISIMLRVDPQLKVQVFSGCEKPLSGWYSPNFNRLQKTTSLVFSKEIFGDSVFKSEVTIL